MSMGGFDTDICNALVFAFASLKNKNNQVSKSQLKVLTASFGTLIGCPGVEKGLEDYRSTTHLSFEDYFFYLKKELFVSSLEPNNIIEYRNLGNQLEEVCWHVCKHIYLKQCVITEKCVYQWFRIFCLLSKWKNNDVEMDLEELNYILAIFMTCLGESSDLFPSNKIMNGYTSISFSRFLQILESHFNHCEKEGFHEASQEVYDTFIDDILKKGYLKKKIKMGVCSEAWFILRPYSLTWFLGRSKRLQLGQLMLNSSSHFENSSNSSSFIIHLVSGSKRLHLSARDHRNKVEWVKAFSIAFEFAQSKLSYQKSLSLQRQREREVILLQRQHEEAILKQQKQLEFAAERQARLHAETLLHQETKQRKDLEEEKKKLELLLEEDKLIIKDEQIVRALQSRLLVEEWENREKLEKRQAEQETLLKLEEEKRQQIEEEKKIQLDKLAQELDQIEKEKRNLNYMLQATEKRLIVAEQASSTLLRTKKKALARTNSVDLSYLSLDITNAELEHFL